MFKPKVETQREESESSDSEGDDEERRGYESELEDSEPEILPNGEKADVKIDKDAKKNKRRRELKKFDFVYLRDGMGEKVE